MKKCPFCAEDIQDNAVKCRHCGEFLNKKPQVKWYFKTSVIIVAFLCVGPFALPLIWFNPNFNLTKKVIITLAIIILSYYLGIMVVKSLKSLNSYYELLQQLY